MPNTTRRTHPHPKQPAFHLLIDIVQILEVQPADFILLGLADVTPRNPVDDKQQDTRDNERPGRAGDRRRELVAELDPVVVPPAAGVGVAADAVEGGDEFGGEEAGEDVADEAAHAVDREDVQAFVDGEEVFVFVGELGGVSLVFGLWKLGQRSMQRTRVLMLAQSICRKGRIR